MEKIALKFDLPVAERAEAAGALQPALVAAVDALLRRRVELGVLDVEHLDALVIDVDEAEIVHALLDEVAGVVVDVAALVAADRVEEHLEGVAVEHVLARMDFEAEIDAVVVVGIEDRLPAPRLLGEAVLDQPGGPLRIGIEIGPGERAGEGHMLGRGRSWRETLAALLHLLGRPLPPLLRIAAHCGRRTGRRTSRHRRDGPRPSGPGDGSRVR